jgi:hypothetical protein
VRIDQLRQFQYCPKRNRGMIPLWKLIAKNWIEHPSRNGDLVSFGKLDYKTFLLEAAQGAHYFYFRSIKRMMSVMNLLERKFVSSMMIRCAIASPPIF